MGRPTIDHDPPISAPHQKLTRTPMSATRWTDGFWSQRFDLCRAVILPAMKAALEHPNNTARLSNFRVAAGLEAGEHQGTDWGDGDCYKWIEALAHVHAVTRDGALDREMDHWIDLIARSQDSDGYIGTQVQLDPTKDRWGARHFHELYNHGHLMTAACAHARSTGKDTFVAVAQKLADYLHDLFAPRPKELAHFGWNPSNIMGLVDLYRVTGEARYLELAATFVDMRGSGPSPHSTAAGARPADPHPGDQNQDHVPLRDETEAVGHAVTAAYLYCGATDVLAETGEQALAEALERIWRNVIERKMYVTGAIGAYHHGTSSRHDLVHEAFGREYELPSRLAYNETCANIGNAMWNMRLLSVTGDARYADVMERVLYNSALSPMDVGGTRFCYTNPLARRVGASMLSNDTVERWSEFTCYCCPPQVARTLAQLHEWVYATSPDGVWVHLYGGSVLKTDVHGRGAVRLVQETDYPWDGMVRLTVEEAPGGDFAIFLRVPDWAEGASARLNGATVAPAPKPGSHCRLEHAWSAGDVVELSLPMRPRLIQSHPLVEETQYQVAVMRGPVVYCLEGVDLPAHVRAEEIHLPRDIDLRATHIPDLLGGVTVLEGTAVRRPGPDWEGRLYQEISRDPDETIEVRLIPYYAWLNRGECDMRVWLPLA